LYKKLSHLNFNPKFFIWYNTIILTSSCNTRSRGLKALSIVHPTYSAWRRPCSLAETCSRIINWYNLTKHKVVYDYILCILYIIVLAFQHNGDGSLGGRKKNGYICKRNWLNTTVGFPLQCGWWSTVWSMQPTECTLLYQQIIPDSCYRISTLLFKKTTPF